jgi:uracil phosphoribosyltransferase
MRHPDQVGQTVVLKHPLVQHKLTLLRRRETPVADFRRIMREISLLLAYEATRGLALETVAIETPLEPMQAPLLSGKKLCFVSILRAGQGILDGMLDLVPSARVGHVGLYRDHTTLQPVEYYCKLPEDIAARDVIVVDPMLATGHSAAAAITRLHDAGASRVSFVCVIAAPEGVGTLSAAHPEVPIYTAAVDRGLDANGYIRPGLGDAGDRLFGTR